MTRAYLHLFQGDLEGALHFHPLFWLVPIVFGIVLFKKKSENQQTLLQSQPVGDIDTFGTSGLWWSALASFPT